jgi:N-acetylneuraminic acid mutarotase/HEAT repeat protein
MNPRTILFLMGVVIYLAAIGPAQCAEPSYQGKPLSEWLLELERRPSDKEFAQELQKQNGVVDEPENLYDNIYARKRKRDEDAIRQMGKRAVPTLLEMLGATSANVGTVVRKLAAEELHNDWWRDEAHVGDLRDLAIAGFEVLGTNAESAVPELTKLFHQADTSYDAARALTKVGPKGVEVLTRAINNPNDPHRNAAIWWLREAPIDDKTKDRLLMQGLDDANDINRHNAAQFMTGKDPAAIPRLIRMLGEDDNYLAVSGAADALAKFGPAAKEAAPKLFSIYTNHVVTRDRHEAETWAFSLMTALKAIDRDTAAKAELFLVNSGPLNHARQGYTLTKLTNGQELIAGGYLHTEVASISNQFLARAELNDPVTGKWSETAAMNTARNSHTATLLRDGKVLVAGGTDAAGHALASCELYDPASGKWNGTGPLNTARFYHAAALQADGRVMIAGGHTGSAPLSDTEFYDPATGKWTTGPAEADLLPTPRWVHSATLLPNGKVLIAGGRRGYSDVLASAELYDPATDTWTSTGAMKIGRMGHLATLLPNGQVLVIGGNASPSDASDRRAEMFNPTTGDWKVTGPSMSDYSVSGAVLLRNGKLLMAGKMFSQRRPFAELYDPATGQWSATSALPDFRQEYTATLLANGKVLIAGGNSGADNMVSILADARIYDPASGKWAPTGSMNAERWRHTATLLADGRVLVAGGSSSWLGPLSSAELYDPRTGKWTLTGEMHHKRYDHTATVLSTGEVLVVGSYDHSEDENALSSAEVYNPTTGVWQELHRLNADHTGHTATLLPNGKVLIVGGDAVGRMELYDLRAAR